MKKSTMDIDSNSIASILLIILSIIGILFKDSESFQNMLPFGSFIIGAFLVIVFVLSWIAFLNKKIKNFSDWALIILIILGLCVSIVYLSSK